MHGRSGQPTLSRFTSSATRMGHPARSFNFSKRSPWSP